MHACTHVIVSDDETTRPQCRCISVLYLQFGMREVDDEAIARSELYVDTRAGALSESGEILGAIARGIIDQTAVRGELSDLAAGLFKRTTPHAITIFKSVGTALEDLVAAELALGANQNRAQRKSAGFGTIDGSVELSSDPAKRQDGQ